LDKGGCDALPSLIAAADVLLEALDARSELEAADSDGPTLGPVADALLGLLIMGLRTRHEAADTQGKVPGPFEEEGLESSAPRHHVAAEGGAELAGASGKRADLALASHIIERLLTCLAPVRGEGGEDSPCAPRLVVPPAAHALRRTCARLLYEAADATDLWGQGFLVKNGCVPALTGLVQIGDCSADTIHTDGALPTAEPSCQRFGNDALSIFALFCAIPARGGFWHVLLCIQSLWG